MDWFDRFDKSRRPAAFECAVLAYGSSSRELLAVFEREESDTFGTWQNTMTTHIMQRFYANAIVDKFKCSSIPILVLLDFRPVHVRQLGRDAINKHEPARY
jgi:hypothetical protein